MRLSCSAPLPTPSLATHDHAAGRAYRPGTRWLTGRRFVLGLFSTAIAGIAVLGCDGKTIADPQDPSTATADVRTVANAGTATSLAMSARRAAVDSGVAPTTGVPTRAETTPSSDSAAVPPGAPTSAVAPHAHPVSTVFRNLAVFGALYRAEAQAVRSTRGY